jgi:hypothetical protein
VVRAELERQAGVRDSATVERQLHLIYDGAALSARMDRDPSVAGVSRATAETVLDAALR